jgi:hypothetical protein
MSARGKIRRRVGVVDEIADGRRLVVAANPPSGVAL